MRTSMPMVLRPVLVWRTAGGASSGVCMIRIVSVMPNNWPVRPFGMRRSRAAATSGGQTDPATITSRIEARSASSSSPALIVAATWAGAENTTVGRPRISRSA